jgi:ABC-2 type transport system ATP-binding protein
MTPAIQAEGLTRRFGEVEALRGLSFDVAQGELFGLIGPDGAGKTTTIRALAGLITLDAGTVRVLGADPIAQGGEVRESLGLMPQYYSLYGDLTVMENLRFFGRLFCLPRKAFDERAARLLEITRLATFTGRRADALSGGMYKKLALACALLHQPRVLLLDEPTNGVDPISRRELWDLLYEFVAEGMAVLISTPYMDEAERCHRVGLVHQGRFLALGDPKALVRDEVHEAFEVEGGDRARIDPRLSELPEVVLVSPAGARLRVVVSPGSGETVARALAPLGAALRPMPLGFEDLFLVRVGEGTRDR